MLSTQKKIYFGITVIVVAVILLVVGLHDLFFKKGQTPDTVNVSTATSTVITTRNPLTGLAVPEDFSFFPIAIMIDNSYTVRPQSGLALADIIYEALAESNITRIVAIFDSNSVVEKIGPVRSARNYYMDWAQEYGGLYMHVGGSPQALSVIKNYNFINIDQIGAGETYFWRDQKLSAPSNVFTSNSNWLRAGEMKEQTKMSATSSLAWLWQEADNNSSTPPNFEINYSIDFYKVAWRYSETLHVYQRWQNNVPFTFDTGEQAQAQNIIVQIAPSHLIDIERRAIDTKAGGVALVFNARGQQTGTWKFVAGRTRFYDSDGQEIKLVPGKTWVQIIDNREQLVVK